MPKTTPPSWNLADLYKSITDPAIQHDLTRLTENIGNFTKEYQSSLTNEITPHHLKKLLDDYSGLLEIMRRLEAYAYLEHSTHQTASTYGAFFQNIVTALTDLNASLIFVEVGLAELLPATLQKLIGHTDLTPYRHFLEKKLQERQHKLSVAEEMILQQKFLTGRQSLLRLYNFDSARAEAVVQIGAKKGKARIPELMSQLRESKRARRQAATAALGVIAKERAERTAIVYNAVMQDMTMEARLRSFAEPAHMRHLDNEVASEAVASMTTAVTADYPLVHEYYRFKRRILGVKKLHGYDRYAPLAAQTKKYSFAEARTIILAAFHNFSPTFADIAQQFFDKGWIDARVKPDKQSGAFCHYVTPRTHPYILVNYQGNIDDVVTLAHELGHGIHAYLARKQHVLHFDWPITMAETASIFAEMIVFRHLLPTLPNRRQRLALYMARIESIFATVFRQSAIYTFELAAHKERQWGELAPQQLNALWLKEQQTMFGSSLTITPPEAGFWTLIPHIFHTPFYVYGYAFGELVTLALYAQFQKDPRQFVPKYESLLTAGGSQSPAELLAPFSFDPADPRSWQPGLAEIKKLFAEAQKLA